jgi:hypothetical protein
MPDMSSVRPTSGTFHLHFAGYIALVTEPDLLEVLESQIGAVEKALAGLSAQKAASRYAEGKWTVSEVLGHVVDAERVFGYRAVATARGERAVLPGFDENAWANASSHAACPVGELVEELAALRRSHVLMFRHFDAAAWDRLGLVAGHPNATRSWGFIMAGHLRHHARVLTERYGVPVPA